VLSSLNSIANQCRLAANAPLRPHAIDLTPVIGGRGGRDRTLSARQLLWTSSRTAPVFNPLSPPSIPATTIRDSGRFPCSMWEFACAQRPQAVTH